MSIRGLTITTAFPTAKLTTLTRFKSTLGVTTTSDDAVMDDAIGRASAAVDKFCCRTFVRQSYTELGPAFGGIEFQVKQAPIAGSLGTITFDGTVLTDVSIGDKGQGVLYRQGGFAWTAQSFAGLSGGNKLWDFGIPISGQEEPTWSVSYTAGFIPGGYAITSGKLKVLATDDSFNDTASGWAPIASHLKSGDIIETSGWTNGANNGRHIITGTPTSVKIATTSTLTAEATSTGRTVEVQSLPLDVEQAVLETAKSYYQQRKTDSAVVEKQMGMARLRMAEQGSDGGPGLPPRAVGLLRPWVRRA